MPRRPVVLLVVLLASMRCPMAGAGERSVAELPKDVWEIAFGWTQPLHQASVDSLSSNTLNSLWLGLVGGSIGSVGRTASFLLFPLNEPATSEPAKQYRYSF